MASLNKVVLIGNLTRDPELRHTQSGTALCEFGLAVTEKYKSGDEWKEKTAFIDITVWNRQAETCSEYLSKGSQCAVDGKITMDQWDDKETGKRRTKLKVTANQVVFLGKARGQVESDGVPF